MRYALLPITLKNNIMNLRVIFLCIIACLSLGACSSIDRSTPEATLTGYYEALKAGDVDRFMEYVYIDGSRNSKEEVNSLRNSLAELLARDLKVKEGLQEFKIEKIDISNDGQDANADVLRRFGTDSEFSLLREPLIKIGDEWYMNLLR